MAGSGLLAVETWVQYLVTSSEICGGVCWHRVFLSCFSSSDFHSVIVHTHPSLPYEACTVALTMQPGFILSVLSRCFIFDVALGKSQYRLYFKVYETPGRKVEW